MRFLPVLLSIFSELIFIVFYIGVSHDLFVQNTLLEFARVVKAKEQVVAGKMYHLTLEAIDAGKKQIYEAKVWVKPWMNFKQLQEFKPTHDASSSFASTGLGVMRGKQLLLF